MNIINKVDHSPMVSVKAIFSQNLLIPGMLTGETHMLSHYIILNGTAIYIYNSFL